MRILLPLLWVCAPAVGCGSVHAPAPDATDVNQPPTANAGLDQDVDEWATVSLDGTASADPEASSLEYAWSLVSGPAVELADLATATPTFRAPIVPIKTTADVTLRLTVTDSEGEVATDDVVITVRSADYLVFIADRDTPGLAELFAYDAETDAITKLSRPSGGEPRSVVSFAISPDGKWVAYKEQGDPFATVASELYVAAADGSAVTRVSGTTNFGANDVAQYQWAPDSSRIAFIAVVPNELGEAPLPELYTATPEGGISDQAIVNGPAATGGSVQDFAWAPDGMLLAFRVASDAGLRVQLQTATPTGEDLSTVNDPLAVESVGDFRWAPDSSRLAYTMPHLHSAAPDGTGRMEHSQGLALFASVARFEWAPDSSHIAYLADAATDEVYELFSVEAGQSTGEKINAPLPAGQGVLGFAWAPDSSRIAFYADKLYTAADTASPVVVSPRVGTGDLLTGGKPFEWSPDGSSLACLSDRASADVFEVHVVSGDGSNTRTVSGTMPADGDALFPIGGRIWSPDGTRVLYRADQALNGAMDLFSGAADGSGTRALSTAPSNRPNLFASHGVWAPDGSRVVFVGERDTADASPPADLHLAQPDGSGGPMTIYAGPPSRTGVVRSATAPAWAHQERAPAITYAPGPSL